MTQFVNDTFTGESEATLLTSHTSEGTTWTMPIAGGSTVRVHSAGTAYADGGGSTFAFCQASNTPPGADYSVTANIVYGTSGVDAGPMCRLQADGSCYFAINYVNGGVNATEWILYKRSAAGSLTNLGTYDESGFLTNGQTYAVKLDCTGTAIKLYIDGVQRISVTDSAISAAGKAGIVMYDNIMQITSVSADTLGSTLSASQAESGSAADAMVVLQMLRPSTDTTPGNWTNSAGGSVFSAINEVTPDDVIYAQSGNSPTNDLYRTKLNAGQVPVATGAGFYVFSYRISSVGSGSSAVIKLWQGNGSTLIASWTHASITNSFVRFDQTLTAVQQALMTDITDLYMDVIAS